MSSIRAAEVLAALSLATGMPFEKGWLPAWSQAMIAAGANRRPSPASVDGAVPAADRLPNNVLAQWESG
ncbi:hypothetical protein IU486_18510 [Streptomyces gardneri]|uniref:hypothetical protein n=1 Tax=Nocardia TaxID=1817 RepID=UPI00135CDB86|nr:MULTISPECIES: hypothetical protein [Nocardia]MBF6166729.1 hypothetical protein [Streptomyces gardneri]MBF6205344.1 hypothetical protein [Streptomyces gardneri]